MPQKSIYDKKRQKLVKSDNNESALFKFLLKHKGQTFTQTKLVEELNIPKSTISRLLRKLQTEDFLYRNKTYRVVNDGGKYKLTDSTQIPQPQKRNEILEPLDNRRLWLCESAKRINDYAILYDINSRLSHVVEEALTNLFGEYIYAIIRRESRLYIVLGYKDKEFKDVTDDEKKKLKKVGDEIIGLYALNFPPSLL